MVSFLQRIGAPVTREEYIALNWMGQPPSPWTAEDEDMLPEELQNWQQFETAK